MISILFKNLITEGGVGLVDGRGGVVGASVLGLVCRISFSPVGEKFLCVTTDSLFLSQLGHIVHWQIGRGITFE